MRIVRRSSGFTIVELLIVIVVIAILAAITIVAYNGIQNRAKTSAAQTAVSQASKKIQVYSVQNSDQYPASLSAIDLADTDSIKYLYSSDNDASPRLYCVTATNGNFSSYISNTSGSMKTGVCPGHWDKTQGSSSAPIAGMTYDTAVFRTSSGSMRLSPSANPSVRGGPFTGTNGQTLTIGVWIKTDASWNGSAATSKIRFGDAQNGGALVGACGYNGAKVNWTFVSCTYTFSTAIPSVNVTVANDGSTSIWFDDFSMSYPGM